MTLYGRGWCFMCGKPSAITSVVCLVLGELEVPVLYVSHFIMYDARHRVNNYDNYIIYTGTCVSYGSSRIGSWVASKRVGKIMCCLFFLFLVRTKKKGIMTTRLTV